MRQQRPAAPGLTLTAVLPPVRAEVWGSPTRGDVVIVPGFAVYAYLRRAARAFAATGWRCWLLRPPTWPGNGQYGDAAPSMADLGASVAEWLSEHELHAVLVGHSVGAQLAAHAAVSAPESARALVLHGATADPAYRTAPRLLARWALDLPNEPPTLLASQAPEWVRAGPRRLVRLLDACLDDSLDDTVARVGCPVLAVVGRRDTLCRRVWAAQLAGSPPVVIPGGHSAVFSRPQTFARVVTALVPPVLGHRME